MGLEELPAETLSEIFDYISDCYEFMNLVQVCKKFQMIIQNKVLIITDSKQASKYFQQISNRSVHMKDPNDLIQYNSTIRSFSYFIIEFAKRHSHEKSILLDDYVLNVVYNKRSKWQKVVKALLTQESIETLSRFVLHENPKLYQHSGLEYIKYLETQLMEVHRTICLTKISSPGFIYGTDHSQLEVMGHEYDFFEIKYLPRIYFHVNSKYDFSINCKSLEVLNGVVNTSMNVPRLPPLAIFLEKSHLPNLRTIEDISIEAGMSLKIFEKFKLLESLSLQSASTESVSLQPTTSEIEPVELNLNELVITGNALSLSSLNLPCLERLSIHVYGSNERSFEQTLFFKDVQCPNLILLELHIGLLVEGFAYIAKELKEYIKNVESMSISTPSISFPGVFENLEFDNLIDLTLKHNEIDIITDLSSEEQELYESSFPFHSLDISKLKFPKLQTLNLLEFDKFNCTFLDDAMVYPNLTGLMVLFKVGEKEQHFKFKKDNFPNLSKLFLKYSNRYGPLKECDIYIEIESMPNLTRIFYDRNLLVSGQDVQCKMVAI